jgi:YidC/Oxa1 family membrane protein insertase
MDRRTVWAILLMMAIAVAPALFLKRPAPAPSGASRAERPTAADRAPAAEPATGAPNGGSPAAGDTASAGATRAPTATAPTAPTAPAGADTVRVTSPLYTYGFSTRGGRMVEATLQRHRSMAPGHRGQPAQIIPDSSNLLALTLVLGRDTIPLRDWTFTPSTERLAVGGPTSLRLRADRGPIGVELVYAFRPDEYQVGVSGRVTGIGPNGGLLLVGMGPTLANTEADSNENHHALALVTKRGGAERTDFGGLDAGEVKTLSGPFEWAAVKSKYFVTGLLAFDSTGGRIAGASAAVPAGAGKRPTRADVRLSLPVGAAGTFGFTLYAGPMEHDRLSRLGHDFDDVNPYGWPGLRALIRPVAVGVRWLLVWMHEHLHLAYGVVLITFGILVRLILWPLNQKAMRANMQLQAVQPLMKDIQERYKNDPQRMQQEMFKLYKEHGVNPLGGCWPMLLPLPVLFALFFVFQNTIELRGASFLWLPDLSRPDPLYIVPVLMGLSMFGLSKVGQMGMEPNPQAKMMLYVMPVMMTVFFLNFASGLNLYYAVSNLASIPQQWLLARERQRRTARAIAEVKTAPEAMPTRPRAKKKRA